MTQAPPSGNAPGGASRSARPRRVAPRPRVVLSAMILLVFLSILLVHGHVSGKFSPDHTSTGVGSQATVPPHILTGGPIINTTGGQVRSHRLPDRAIALTFDDGPDPTWTPQILDVLGEHGVPGTFFVVGTQVVRHPKVVRRIAAEGHELGVHTFTHPHLAQVPGWLRRLEYSQTQLAIADAAGVTSTLLRFPYSSRPEAIDDDSWGPIREAGALGYLVVVNDTDSQDWARPGADRIVANATPRAGESAIVLLHDAGGDRSQTVEALRQLIPELKRQGYRFTTITGGLHTAVARSGGTAVLPQNPPATDDARWRGSALVWTVRLADGTVGLLAALFVIVGLLTIGRTLVLLLLAGRHARRRRSPSFSWGPPVTDPVSVIVPAYNEKEGIEAAVRSLAGGDYPQIEVVVVDDGSTDETAALAEGLGLPNVRVVRVPNGGKPNALNTGVALARHELIVMVDGDTIFEPDSIRRLVQPFADPRVGAVAGNVKVGNRGNLVSLWQHIEYVIGFNLDRRLYEVLRCMPTVPGAIGAFRRTALRDVGGMSDETLAEDTDVTIALCRAGWWVVYEEHARAWTEAPATLGQLYRQRYRWSYGTMQAMWKHRRAMFDPGPSGRFGRFGLPFLALFGVALPMLAPVVDVLTLWSLLFWDRSDTAVAWVAMLALQTLTAVIAFRMDRESLRPLWTLPLQQLAYRQLMYLVLIQSATTALTGGRLRWHKLHRAGLTALKPAKGAAVPTPPVTAPPTGQRVAGPPVAGQRVAGQRVAGQTVPGQPAGYHPVHAQAEQSALGRPGTVVPPHRRNTRDHV